MEEKEIQILGVVLSVTCLIISSLFILFFIGVSKVDAYTSAKSNIWVNGQRCITNDMDGLGTMSCLNNSVTWYNARTDANLSMTTGKKYTFFYRSTIKVPFSNTGNSSNLNVVVSYKRGSTLGDMTSCTTTQSHTITYNSTNPVANKLVTHEIAVACQGVQFSAATDGIVIRAQVDNSGTMSSAMQVKISQIYLDQDTTDNTEITNAIDNAQQSIINNQNNNTQTIINNNNSNTQIVTDAIEDIMEFNGWTNENPNETPANNHDQAEEDLEDYLTDDSDISNLDYSIDVNSSTAIWGIFNDIFTGNQIVYTGGLTILFMGLIKLILAR